MTAFSGDEYESLCIAIGMIDAANDALSALDDWDEVEASLNDTRNQLNGRRLEILWVGKGRPFNVADLIGGK